jgi:hypothetical protein
METMVHLAGDLEQVLRPGSAPPPAPPPGRRRQGLCPWWRVMFSRAGIGPGGGHHRPAMVLRWQRRVWRLEPQISLSLSPTATQKPLALGLS